MGGDSDYALIESPFPIWKAGTVHLGSERGCSSGTLSALIAYMNPSFRILVALSALVLSNFSTAASTQEPADPQLEFELNSSLALSFKAAALTILESIGEKQDQMGDFNITATLGQIQQVQWGTVEGFFDGSGKQRCTAENFIDLNGKPTVILSLPGLSQVSSKHHPLLALHEALGAIGYDDEDYQLTIALQFLSTDFDTYYPIFKKYLKDLKRTSTNRQYDTARGNFSTSPTKQILAKNRKSGTSTSVGSGGDFVALIAKYLFIQQLVLADSKLLEAALNLKFEPLWTSYIDSFQLSFTTEPGLVTVPSIKILAFATALGTDDPEFLDRLILGELEKITPAFLRQMGRPK